MNDSGGPDSDNAPAWIRGQGQSPQLSWMHTFPGQLICLDHARESGDCYVADASGTISRINRRGELIAAVPMDGPIVSLKWSDDGSRGAIIAGEDLILRLDQNLRVTSELTLPDVCVSIAVSPYGNHLAAGLADGTTLIFNERKRRIAKFETLRPLSCLNFCIGEPILFGTAEHGLVCCHNLAGALIWQQTTFSNVGQLCCTGTGDLLYLAGYSYGVQTLDGDGASVGSYVLDGTVNRVDTSDEPGRIVAATIERSLSWLSATGDLLWETVVPDDVVNVVCDPLGAWAMCGLKAGELYRLSWSLA